MDLGRVYAELAIIAVLKLETFEVRKTWKSTYPSPGNAPTTMLLTLRLPDM